MTSLPGMFHALALQTPAVQADTVTPSLAWFRPWAEFLATTFAAAPWSPRSG